MSNRIEVPAPPLGVVHAVLGTLATTDTWRSDPVVDTFSRLLDAVAEPDAVHLPAALGECLLPLRGSPEELELALDVIVAFDLHEAARGLVPLLRESPERRAVEAAAAMALHPAAHSILRELVEMSAGELASDLAKRVRMLLTGQLPAGASDVDAWRFAERWPGRVGVDQAAAPLVVVLDDAGTPAQRLHLLLELRRAGAHVRRLNTRHRPVDGWLPAWAVVVGGDGRPAWWPEGASFRATHGSLGAGGRRGLLRWLNRRFGGPIALRTMASEGGDAAVEDPLLDIDAFLDGALQVPEVSFLTGWSHTTVRYRGKDHVALRPRIAGPGGVPIFDFAQLTALRVERYLAHEFGRRSDPDLAADLVSMARSERSVPTHVTSEGQVLFEHDAETFVDRAGQTSFSLVAIGDVARTFEIGSGHTVPELLHPSLHTTVHPSVQRGTPVVQDTRISAAAVRDVVALGQRGGFHGSDLGGFVRQYFPELDEEQMRDADTVGRKILA